MARTVQLSEEAYEKLALLKQTGESFSDVVNRIVGSLKDPRKLLELSPPAPGPSWEEVDEKMRKADQKRAREILEPDRPPSKR